MPNIKIISNPLQLSPEEIDEFSCKLRTNEYKIATTKASTEIYCDGIYSNLQDKTTYETMLDDKNGSFNYYSIRYKTGIGHEILIPIGLYGNSPQWKVNFPIIINGLWMPFLRLSKDEFCAICGIQEEQEQVDYFSRLLKLRRKFIDNIFKYYASIDSEYCSFMCWEVRKNKSITRQSAESMSFNRLIYDKIECYSSKKINSHQWKYLKKCINRLGEVNVDSVQSSLNYEQSSIVLLLQGLVAYVEHNNLNNCSK